MRRSLRSDWWLLVKKRRLSVTVALLGLLLAMAPVIWGLIDKFMSHPELGEPGKSTIEGVQVFGVVVLVATLIFTALTTTFEFEDEIAALRDLVGGASNYQYLGSASEIAKTFESRLRDAESVRNTFVAFGISSEQGEFQTYMRAMLPKVRKRVVKEVVDHQKGAWTDIFSKESLGDPELRAVVESLEKKYPTYEARYLNEQYPILNCMLLNYGKKKDPEVLFGWGFHPQDKVGDVFSSSDPNLYRSFALYWQTLRDDSLPVLSANHVAVTGHDIAGLWFDAAYEEGGTSVDGPPMDLALIEISIVDKRRIVVEGKLFDVDCKPKGTFHSRAAQLHDHELWFVSEGSGNLGAGCYKFIHPNTGQRSRARRFFSACAKAVHWKQSQVAEKVYGEFIGHSNNKPTRITIEGRKIDGEYRFPEDPDDEVRLVTGYWEKLKKIHESRVTHGQIHLAASQKSTSPKPAEDGSDPTVRRPA